MKYVRPRSIAEAVRVAQEPGTVVLAGGTDLVLQMREGKIKPDCLLDLQDVPGLKEIKEVQDSLEIGSMVTFAQLGQSDLIRMNAFALWQACQTMGSPQIRQQATLGGNLGNCSPAADGIPPLLVLNAKVRLATLAGEESISLEDFLERFPLLNHGTLIMGFRLPLEGWKSGFAKLGRRRALAIARLNVAVAVKGQVSAEPVVRVALGAVGQRAFLSHSLSSALSGQAITPDWIEQAVNCAQETVRFALGERASAFYKRVAIAGVIRKALASLTLEGGKSSGN